MAKVIGLDKMKTKIFTYAFNNPKYLEYQIKTLNKFALDPFEFICVDNSIDKSVSAELRNVLKTVFVTQSMNNQTIHCQALHIMLQCNGHLILLCKMIVILL